MLTAKFYTFSKKARSTARPSSGNTDLSIALKSPASVLSPVIEVGSISNPTVYNYCYLVDFSKYYYINDWVYDRGIWSAYLTEDLLATYKTQIGNTSMYVERSSNSYDGTIIDKMYPTKTGITYQITRYDGFVPPQDPIGFDDGVFILGVLGNNNQNAQSVMYYQLDANNFISLLNGLYANISSNVWGTLPDGVKKSLFDPFQYIVSCIWFPYIPFAVEGPYTDLNVGGWSSNVNYYIVNTQLGGAESYTFTVPKHPQAATRGNYLNTSPYTQYKLQYLPLGVFDLDTTKITGNKLYVSNKVDPITGESVLSVYSDQLWKNPVLKANGMFGVSIAIGQITSNVIGAISSPIQTALNTFLAHAVGFISIGDSVAAAIPESTSIKGTNGGLINHQLDKELYSTFYPIVDEDLANKGRPLCQKKTPATIGGGYILPTDVALSIPATESEISTLTSTLESGFYYE